MVIYTTDNGPWNQPAYTERKRYAEDYVTWKEEHANFRGEDEKFWGDSGPLRNGKGSCYEGGLRVPCIVRWPGKVPGNSVSDAIFATIDFLPTFVSLAGGEIPDDRKIDGVDQTDLLLGKSREGARDNFFYVHAYRKGKWKYLEAEHDIYGYSRDTSREIKEELYDLSADMGETNNLADRYPEMVEELRNLLEKERKDGDLEVITKIR